MTTNRTERRWIHDEDTDDEEEGEGDGDEFEEDEAECWLRFRGFLDIYTFSSVKRNQNQ